MAFVGSLLLAVATAMLVVFQLVKSGFVRNLIRQIFAESFGLRESPPGYIDKPSYLDLKILILDVMIIGWLFLYIIMNIAYVSITSGEMYYLDWWTILATSIAIQASLSLLAVAILS